MNELQKKSTKNATDLSMTIEDRLAIIEEGVRKRYLSRLTEMEIVSSDNLPPMEEDLIDNVRLYKISEIVYHKGEVVTDKFNTVFNTISTYNASVFIVMDSDGKKIDFYIGVRNNEIDELKKRSTVTLADTLKNALMGHFPGVKIENEDRSKISVLCQKIQGLRSLAAVSVVGSIKNAREQANEQFVQGLEKLALAMQGRQYTAIIIAENQSSAQVQEIRKNYQSLYTALSPYQKIQFTASESDAASRSQSFSEMNGKQKAVMIGNAAISAGGAVLGNLAVPTCGGMIGGQIAGQLTGFLGALAPVEQLSKSIGTSQSTTTENKAITDLLQLLDDMLKRLNEFDSYGMWNIASYFLSDDMSTAEIAASNYRSLMNGETSGREVSAINSWKWDDSNLYGRFSDITRYLARFQHPAFFYGVSDSGVVLTNAATAISGKELGLHIGFPRNTVSGFPVIEHAEFGKDVISYQLFEEQDKRKNDEKITVGRVFDLGKITDKIVELENKSLNMHTFITGSTGSGKSNTVYQILTELHREGIPFLVVEPAKGEYKDAFGNWEDVNVYSTNPNIAELINLNPFQFPSSIHVLEHIDGLVEIFSVCWPMYDAMPAFFKEAILKSYESVGWDLAASVFEGDEIEYPDFEILTEELNELIEDSDYSPEIKSNYRGALITRVASLTVGLNKFVFTTKQTPYKKLFDENCILDISRVKSAETKALIMGLVVYALNEYRVSEKKANNNSLKHITVLEEAHNILKNTSGNSGAELINKSVEMLTQTIAEIRTYGEGFIIVDQSPSSVDIAAIKNTNTKIVLRTPESNDRDVVGKSMGLSANQVNEIAKLPSGVAVVYQNNWVNPVLTLVDKAPIGENPYVPNKATDIYTEREARTLVIKAIMQPWLSGELIDEKSLMIALKTINVSRRTRNNLKKIIEDYVLFGGCLIWKEEDIYDLQQYLQQILDLDEKRILRINTAEELQKIVCLKTRGMKEQDINEICFILTKK